MSNASPPILCFTQDLLPDMRAVAGDSIPWPCPRGCLNRQFGPCAGYIGSLDPAQAPSNPRVSVANYTEHAASPDQATHEPGHTVPQIVPPLLLQRYPNDQVKLLEALSAGVRVQPLTSRRQHTAQESKSNSALFEAALRRHATQQLCLRQMLRLQGEGCNRPATAADAEASASSSPVHRVSFAISMDISTLSGISSNVEITPIPDTLPTDAHHRQLWAEDSREDPITAESNRGPTDTEQAAANAHQAAATESTADHAHDTHSETSQQNSTEVQEWPGIQRQSTCWAQQDVSPKPSNSKHDSALAVLPHVQSEALTGSTAAVEEGMSSTDEEHTSEAGGPSEMQAPESHACTTSSFPESLGQLCKLTRHAQQVVD